MKRQSHAITGLLGGLAVVFLVNVPAWSESSLLIRKNAAVEGPTILLQDLVTIPSSLPDGWAKRAVLQSPSPGKPLQYALTTVAYALQQYPDMAQITLRGTPHIVVQRDGTPLDLKEIKEAIVDFLKTDMAWKDRPVQVACDPPRETVLVPEHGEHHLHVEHYMEEFDNSGYYIFDVALYFDGKPERNLPIRTRLIPLQEFWVTTQPLEAGRQLAQNDVRPKLLPTENLRKNYVPVDEPVAGFQIDRAMRADQPLSRNFLQQPICAERGELISVVSRTGALAVILRAKALNTGRLGNKIMCLNEKSNRRLLVQMTGVKQATIDF